MYGVLTFMACLSVQCLDYHVLFEFKISFRADVISDKTVFLTKKGQVSLPSLGYISSYSVSLIMVS